MWKVINLPKLWLTVQLEGRQSHSRTLQSTVGQLSDFLRSDNGHELINKFNKHSRNPYSQLWSHYIEMVEIEIHSTRKDRYLITNLGAFSAMLPSPSSMTTVTLIIRDVFIWQIWNSSRRQRCWWCLEAFITNSKIWCVLTKTNLREEDDTDSDIVREIPLVSLTTKDMHQLMW